MKKRNITWGLVIVVIAFLISPGAAQAQMETKSGDMVLTAGAGLSALSFGFNGNFQFNVTNKIAAHPSVNYNNYGGGTLLSVDAWAGYHGLKNIPFLNASAEGKENIDAYLMFGPTYYSGQDESGFAFGAGGGARYYLNDKIGITVEGKYRMIVGDGYSYVKWYEVGVGLSYSL
ncbi:MAG: hypothetical protein FH748_14120 [Balneolaceae bacterium]|nr:hypothetical protein [Balneolaceae bacterium]